MQTDESFLILVEDGEAFPVVRADDIPIEAAESGQRRVEVDCQIGGGIDDRHPSTLYVRYLGRLVIIVVLLQLR